MIGRSIVHVFAAILLVCSLSVSADSETITLAVGEWAPYTSEHVAKQGFLSHVAEEAFAHEGVSVYWRFMPWKRVRAQVEYGAAEASIGWLKSPEREKKLLYSSPVMPLSYTVFQEDSKRFPVQTDDDLKGKIIGVHIESDYTSLTTLRATEQTTVMRFPNYEAAMKALLVGRIEGVIAEKVVGYHTIRKSFSAVQATRFHLAPTNLAQVQTHLITGKALSNGSEIIATFERGLEKLRASGRFAELLADLNKGVYD